MTAIKFPGRGPWHFLLLGSESTACGLTGPEWRSRRAPFPRGLCAICTVKVAQLAAAASAQLAARA